MVDSVINIEDYFSLYFCYIFIPIGVIGNILSIIIFTGKDFTKQSVSTYLITICIINILYISQIPNKLNIVNYYTNLDVSCKLTFGVLLMLDLTQAWLAVLATVDRLLTVQKQFKFGFKRNKKFQIFIITLIITLILIGSFPLYYAKKSIINEYSAICSYDAENEYLWGKYYALINITLFIVLVPHSVMIIASVFIIKGILRSKHEDIFTDNERLKEIDSAKMIIALDAFLILTSLPNFISGTYLDFVQLIKDILYILHNFPTIFSFFIFYLFNKLFRSIVIQAFKYTLCCLKIKSNLAISTENNKASEAPYQVSNQNELFNVVPVH